MNNEPTRSELHTSGSCRFVENIRHLNQTKFKLTRSTYGPWRRCWAAETKSSWITWSLELLLNPHSDPRAAVSIWCNSNHSLSWALHRFYYITLHYIITRPHFVTVTDQSHFNQTAALRWDVSKCCSDAERADVMNHSTVSSKLFFKGSSFCLWSGIPFIVRCCEMLLSSSFEPWASTCLESVPLQFWSSPVGGALVKELATRNSVCCVFEPVDADHFSTCRRVHEGVCFLHTAQNQCVCVCVWLWLLMSEHSTRIFINDCTRIFVVVYDFCAGVWCYYELWPCVCVCWKTFTTTNLFTALPPFPPHLPLHLLNLGTFLI